MYHIYFFPSSSIITYNVYLRLCVFFIKKRLYGRHLKKEHLLIVDEHRFMTHFLVLVFSFYCYYRSLNIEK